VCAEKANPWKLASLLLVAALITLAAAPAARASSPRVPYMGIDTWYALGSNLTEQTVEALADQAVTSRLRDAGYRYLWLDAGWWNGTRDGQGNIALDPTRWPHGMAAVAAHIHAKGMLAAIYVDAGPTDCSGGTAGSYGHYQQDADTFAAWGFDAIKVDNCGGSAIGADPRVLYGQFAQALQDNGSHRTIWLNVCNPLEPGMWGGRVAYANSSFDTWSWAPALATSWRVSYDIGHPGDVRFAGVMHNLYAAAAHPAVPGSGHFNDPDYLVPDQGMNPTEAQTQFSMWAMLDAPMMLSTSLTSLSARKLAMVENREAIAISQDPLVIQATMVSHGLSEIWVKPVAGGRKAVAFLNPGPVKVKASATARQIGLGDARQLVVRDVWARRTTLLGRRIAVAVPAHGTVLLRVAASRRQLAIRAV
jgi:alpha-galactosidase